MHLNLLLPAISGLFGCVSSAAVPEIFMRQMNASSVCSTFGVDFQSGGNYFINSNSNESFTFVSKFEGCNDDLPSLMLVNKDTTDQYDCGQVPTVPNDTPQLATCQILKNQLVSGTYLIIVIGNNGNGEPFSYQREFTIQIGPQQTITQYPTVTSTTTPIVTTTCKSFSPGLILHETNGSQQRPTSTPPPQSPTSSPSPSPPPLTSKLSRRRKQRQPPSRPSSTLSTAGQKPTQSQPSP